jgi:hypothetical protein
MTELWAPDRRYIRPIKLLMTQKMEEYSKNYKESGSPENQKCCMGDILNDIGHSNFFTDKPCKGAPKAGKILCKSCGRRYGRLDKSVVDICLAEKCNVGVDRYNPYCTNHKCLCCLPKRSIPGFVVVASRIGGCPPLPKDVWKFIFNIYRRTYIWFRDRAHFSVPYEMAKSLDEFENTTSWAFARCPKELIRTCRGGRSIYGKLLYEKSDDCKRYFQTGHAELCEPCRSLNYAD